MKFRIWHKIVLLTTLTVLPTAYFLAYTIIERCKTVAFERRVQDLATKAGLRGKELLDEIDQLRQDCLALRGDPAIRSMLWAEKKGPTDTKKDQEKKLTRARKLIKERFVRLMEHRREYLQIQFIKIKYTGEKSEIEEQVRLQNQTSLPGGKQWFWGNNQGFKFPDNLHDKLVQPHNTMGAESSGPVHFSAVEHNQILEKDQVDSPPLFTLSAYVRLEQSEKYDPENLDKDAAVVIITLDFRPLAYRLSHAARFMAFLLDEDNHVIIHPRKQSKLGFNRDPKEPINEEINPMVLAIHQKEVEDQVLERTKAYHPELSEKEAELAARERLETVGFIDRKVNVNNILHLLKIRVQTALPPGQVRNNLNQRLQDLAKNSSICPSPDGSHEDDISEETVEIVLRGPDVEELKQVGDQLVSEFGSYLKNPGMITSRKFVIHSSYLPIGGKGKGESRYFKLCMAASHDEIYDDLNRQFTVWGHPMPLYLLIAVATAFVFSLWITWPLKKIIAATHEFARGKYDVPLPVRDRGEIGTLARSFAHMGTEIQQHMNKLAESESRNRTILEMAAEGIITVNNAGYIETFNQAASAMFGYTAEEICKQLFTKLLYRPTAEDGTTLEDSFTVGKLNLLPREVTGLRKDGTRFPMEVAGSAFRVGERHFFTCIVRDITTRKQAETTARRINEELEERVRSRTAELRQAMRQLEVARDMALAASRAKDAFVASVSHELRTPLFHVDSFAQLLEFTNLDQEQQSDLTKIRRASAHLLELVNDLLDYQKIIMGKIPLDLKEFDVNTLIQETVEQAQSRAGEGNNLVVKCPPGLGTMRSDPRRVRQVLFNLLSNAFKFTDAGTVTFTVRPLRRGQPGLQFEVTDTGIGMTPEQLLKLFQPFQRLHSQITKPGNGLGLAISRELCQAMGGTIDVTSSPGQGSTFIVWLPVEARELDTHDSGPPLLAKVPAAPPHAHGTVLVIDDDEAVRELMQRFLEKEGFKIRTAANGREGLQLARQLQPDVITLDIRMPDPDGWTVLAQLKHDPETAGIPVIIASMLDDRSHGFALGAEDFITKPFDWPRLARILNKYKIPVGEVLIVDDDAVGRDAMQQLIARQGWKVREASNGRIALERIAERRPDLILLDLLMPDMNGFELVEELRKQPELASIPIVVVTAKEITPDDCRRLSGFVDHCLHKGAFLQEELLAEIRRRVGHHVASDVQANSERRHG